MLGRYVGVFRKLFCNVGILFCCTGLFSVSYSNNSSCDNLISSTNVVRSEPFLLHYSFSPEKPVTGTYTDLLLTICEGTQPVKGRIKVEAVMPAHGHGMNYLPKITQVTDGNYVAKGLLFHMPGLWQIAVRLQQEGDSTLFKINNRVP